MAAKKGRQVHLMEAFDAIEAMRGIRIADGHKTEGAVLVRAVQRAISQLEEEGKNPWTVNVLGNALARFEVEDAPESAE